MKRDLDLIREILVRVEQEPYQGGPFEISIAGRSPDEVSYHMLLLHEAGFVEAESASGKDTPAPVWLPIRLTWSGHEFLDSARSQTLWTKARARVKKLDSCRARRARRPSEGDGSGEGGLDGRTDHREG